MESVKVYVWKLGYVCAEYQSGEDLRFFSGGGDAAAVCDDRSDLEAGRGIAGEEGLLSIRRLVKHVAAGFVKRKTERIRHGIYSRG